MMLDLLWSSVNVGTGRAAALRTPTFGKTGTSQDNRDAIFIGFAKDLVTGVWIGNDDNSPLGDVAGGGAPAEIWRDFMAAAVGGRAAPLRAAQPVPIMAAPRQEAVRGKGRGNGVKKSKGRGKGKKKKK